MLKHDRLFYAVVIMVCLLWGAAVMTSFFSKDFHMPDYLNAAFGAVLVAVLDNRRRRPPERRTPPRRRDRDDD